MEARGLRQRDLIPVSGASSVVSDVLSGKRSISKAHAKKLAEFLRGPVSLFISARDMWALMVSRQPDLVR